MAHTLTFTNDITAEVQSSDGIISEVTSPYIMQNGDFIHLLTVDTSKYLIFNGFIINYPSAEVISNTDINVYAKDGPFDPNAQDNLTNEVIFGYSTETEEGTITAGLYKFNRSFPQDVGGQGAQGIATMVGRFYYLSDNDVIGGLSSADIDSAEVEMNLVLSPDEKYIQLTGAVGGSGDSITTKITETSVTSNSFTTDNEDQLLLFELPFDAGIDTDVIYTDSTGVEHTIKFPSDCWVKISNYGLQPLEDVSLDSTTIKSVDITKLDGYASLPLGSHLISIIAEADGYLDSAPSTKVEFINGYPITITETGCTHTPEASMVAVFESTTFTFTANEHRELPSNITVVGASYTWDQPTGALVLSDVSGNVSVNIITTSATQLATPQNLSLDGTVLSWDAVENATVYEIFADATSIGTVEASAPTYTVTFTASNDWRNSYSGIVRIYDGDDETGTLLLEQNPADKSAFPMQFNITSGFCKIKFDGAGLWGCSINSSDFDSIAYDGYSGIFKIDKNGTIDLSVYDFKLTP